LSSSVHPLSVEILEEPDTAAEDHGDEVDLPLVEQPSLQVLPDDVRAAPDADVLVAAGGGRGRGLGLGLSIVQAIAEAHDALLDVKPRTEGGLVVEVTFSEAASTNGGEPTSASESSNQKSDPSPAVLAVASDSSASHER
jgi:hypothetical protein